MTTQGIERFLDEEGRLKQWPAKQAPREEAFAYLARKFEPGRDYTEHEVNAILSTWHTFGDLFILRRGLIENIMISTPITMSSELSSCDSGCPPLVTSVPPSRRVPAPLSAATHIDKA